VTYEYLTNGRLDVHAKIPGTSRQIELELQREQSLTSERVGRWKKVVEEAKGFDAFEDMLDDVVLAHRVEKRKDTMTSPMGPSLLGNAAMPAGAIAGAKASAGPMAPVSPSRDLSAASRAFGAVGGLDDDASKPATGPAAVATKTAASLKPEPATKTAPAKTAAPKAPVVSKKPMTLQEAAAAKAGAKFGAMATLPGSTGSESAAAESAPSKGLRLTPGIRVLLSVGSLVIVTAISLLVCYYVLAKFGHMGNFLNLPLPGLPPPKAP
jgi:hypothetical protein